MPAMDFPSNPTNGTQTADGRYYFDSSVGSTGAWRSTPLPVGGLPAGSIMAWGTNTPPANWLLADGSAVSRSVYSSLFAVIGTQYGAGDGTTTFNLPDLRGRVPVGRNGGTFGTLGATGGAETHTLTEAQMPSHTHSGSTNTTGGHKHGVWWEGGADSDQGFPAGGFNAFMGTDRRWNLKSDGFPMESAGDHSHSFTTGATGSTQAHNNLQPYQVVNYIIKFSAGWTAGDSELATRVGALETAQATTNRSGLVPVIPSSITVGSGSASVSSNGLVTISGASSVSINNSLLSTKDYYVVFTGLIASGSGDFAYRWRSGTTDISAGYYGINLSGVYTGTSSIYGSMNNGSLGYLGPSGNALTTARMNISPRVNSSNLMNTSYSAWHGYLVTGAYNTNGLSTAPNGITIYTTSSTITGTIQVYAYN